MMPLLASDAQVI